MSARPRDTICPLPDTSPPSEPQEPTLTPDQESPSPAAAVDSVEALEKLILAKLDEDKAEDVVLIDLKGKSSLADALVVASGRSQRHVAAMADRLVRTLKEAGLGRAAVEGLPHADWVLIDAGDVIVHLFRPEVRAFYQIEKIWSVQGPEAEAREARIARSDRAAMGGLS